jgi:hypothetical protein
LFIGDQTDPTLLAKIADTAKKIGGYDVIIDDGGHHAHQMIASFQALWPAIKPGGIYVVEDIHCNYDSSYLRPGKLPFMTILRDMLDNMMCRSEQLPETFDTDRFLLSAILAKGLWM